MCVCVCVDMCVIIIISYSVYIMLEGIHTTSDYVSMIVYMHMYYDSVCVYTCVCVSIGGNMLYNIGLTCLSL